MRVLDLFCGGGGLACGFAQSGFTVTGVDHDARVVAHAQRNLPDHTFECRDLLAHDYAPPGAFDVVVGGPPCQPFSRAAAGRRDGRAFEADPRNGIDAYLAIVERVRPRAIVLEQSPEVLRRTAYWSAILARLDALGYVAAHRVVRMEYWDVPQARRRLIVVALRRHGDDAATAAAADAILASPPCTEPETAGHALSDSPPPLPDARDRLPAPMLARIDRFETRGQRGVRRARVLDRRRPARTLTVRNLGNGTNDSMRLAFAPTPPHAVVDEVLHDGTSGGGNGAYVQRYLTVREAAALHTFPEWWRWDVDEDAAARPTRDMHVIGNSVPPAFARHVATRLRAALDGAGRPTRRRLRS
jgi:DNA (cytosine-5)-methyltransferase 1